VRLLFAERKRPTINHLVRMDSAAEQNGFRLVSKEARVAAGSAEPSLEELVAPVLFPLVKLSAV